MHRIVYIGLSTELREVCCLLIYLKHENDHLDSADIMVQAEIPGFNNAPRENCAFPEKGWGELGCLMACVLMVGLTTVFVLFG